MENSPLIFVVDKDVKFINLVRNKLAECEYNNVVVFTDEKECLKNLKMDPKILIINQQLDRTSGLQIIKKIKSVRKDLFAILASREMPNQFQRLVDDQFIHYVDKLIIKGMDDMNEMMEAIENCMVE
jgi:CheY-like chemotaxis protein